MKETASFMALICYLMIPIVWFERDSHGGWQYFILAFSLGLAYFAYVATYE